MSLKKIGRFLLLVFAGFLPWSVIVSVTGTERLGIEMMRFTKEFFLLLIFLVGLLDMWRRRYRPSFSMIEGAILLYILTLITVSIATGTSLT